MRSRVITRIVHFTLIFSYIFQVIKFRVLSTIVLNRDLKISYMYQVFKHVLRENNFLVIFLKLAENV